METPGEFDLKSGSGAEIGNAKDLGRYWMENE